MARSIFATRPKRRITYSHVTTNTDCLSVADRGAHDRNPVLPIGGFAGRERSIRFRCLRYQHLDGRTVTDLPNVGALCLGGEHRDRGVGDDLLVQASYLADSLVRV